MINKLLIYVIEEILEKYGDVEAAKYEEEQKAY
jgi:hypothetical protein